MNITLYQIDAFADNAFKGNPAAVCPLEQWISDNLMQSIAAENNLSETAFFVANDKGFRIRWFTPRNEVDLCGHATLASAFVLFNIMNYNKPEILFESRSGILSVTQNGDWLEMDFPAQAPIPCDIPESVIAAFGVTPTACLRGQDYIVVFDDENFIREVEPIYSQLEKLDLRGVAITAKSIDYDFVTRFFAPKHGINEDPVTGSAFTQLIPYWSKVLNKTTIRAKQVSKRGGEVRCVLNGDRVTISGTAVKYMVGVIDVHE